MTRYVTQRIHMSVCFCGGARRGLQLPQAMRTRANETQHHCMQVAVLFRSHQDLLEEFTYFLPDGTQSGAVGRVRITF